ncbi:flavodoxin family protein [Evtepia sp.]|uniref:flavodoxin family protein n=1 Tax=Evtepia sp. TaxID=2773933 RepID=UPI003F15224A
MKTAIVYYSKHHGNTKKLIDALAADHDITVIDASAVTTADLSGYDLVGFASGIYYSKFHKTVLEFAEKNLPQGKPVFFLYTYGAEKKGYTKAIAQVVAGHQAEIVGEFGCPGFNTFGPFKLIGGMAKGRPNRTDLENVRRFYAGL